MLFADVVGYSKLPEASIQPYVEHFLGGVATLLEKSGQRPLLRNTWGDAVHLVYETVEEAGVAALEMREWMGRKDWHGLLRLPPEGKFRLRIGLHVGPVYTANDPIISQPCVWGGHANFAARIEPIADEGQVFVSEEFAAHAMADGVKQFRCEYQGFASLPKGAGRIPVYLITPS
jgi:class 3 adenylate cyclase